MKQLFSSLAALPGEVRTWTQAATATIRERHGDAVAASFLGRAIACVVGLMSAVYGVFLDLFGKDPDSYTCARCVQPRPWPPRFFEHSHATGRCEDIPLCGPCWSMKVRHGGGQIPSEIQAIIEEDEAKALATSGAPEGR